MMSYYLFHVACGALAILLDKVFIPKVTNIMEKNPLHPISTERGASVLMILYVMYIIFGPAALLIILATNFLKDENELD